MLTNILKYVVKYYLNFCFCNKAVVTLIQYFSFISIKFWLMVYNILFNEKSYLFKKLI